MNRQAEQLQDREQKIFRLLTGLRDGATVTKIAEELGLSKEDIEEGLRVSHHAQQDSFS